MLHPRVSPVLPDAKHVPVVRLRGLHDWVDWLPNSRAWEVIHLVFGSGQSDTPSPGMYTMPLSCASVHSAYGSSTGPEQDEFDRVVSWIGPDEVPTATAAAFLRRPVASPAKANVCYLTLFRDNWHDRMFQALGENAWGPAIAGALWTSPGIASSGTFRLSFREFVRDSGHTSYVQAHIEPAAGGLTVAQVLPLICGQVRVGADGQRAALLDPLVSANAASSPTRFDINPAGPHIDMPISVYARVGGAVGKENIRWNPMTHTATVLMLAAFESVRIMAAEFKIRVDGGATNGLFAAIVPTSFGAIGGNGWYSAPINMQVAGSADGPVTGVLQLPHDHGFGRELRSATLGNPPPVFCFGWSGSADDEAYIAGTVHLRCSGLATIQRVNIGGSGGAVKAAGSAARRVQATLPYRVAGLAPPRIPAGGPSNDTSEDESESEEDEPAAPTPTAPAQPITAQPVRRNAGA